MTRKQAIIEIDKINVPVKIIQKNKETVLLEWADGDETKRGYLPAHLVILETAETPSAVVLDELASAALYGVPWADVLPVPQEYAAKLAKSLHNANLWTFEDVRTNMDAAVGAVQSALRMDVSTVLATARKYETGE